MKTACEQNKNGLVRLWRSLKARHSALSRAESARKRRSHKQNNHDSFFKDPYQFARRLFRQLGSLTVQREQLETHLKRTHSNPRTSEMANCSWRKTQHLFPPPQKKKKKKKQTWMKSSCSANNQSQVGSRAQWCAESPEQQMSK